jgi:hypothetical protein
MNLHQAELTIDANGKTLSITIQNCVPIREGHFKTHVQVLTDLINNTDGYNVTKHISTKKRNAKCHEAIGAA